jgi:type III secretion system FlhB-like substrate exporter
MSEAQANTATLDLREGGDDGARAGREGDEWRRVVGVAYHAEEGPPRVILKAEGPLAEQVLAARDPWRGPRVVRNEALLQSLYRLPLDSSIGPELFYVVAAILAHVFAADAARREPHK